MEFFFFFSFFFFVFFLSLFVEELGDTGGGFTGGGGRDVGIFLLPVFLGDVGGLGDAEGTTG